MKSLAEKTHLKETKLTGSADYFTRVLTAILQFMLQVGVSKEDAGRVVRRSLEIAEHGGTSGETFGRSSDFVTACLVLDRWRRTRTYLTDVAQPKAVRLFGRSPSVEALVRSERRLRRSTLKADQMKDFGLITHVGRGMYKPSMPSGVVSEFGPAVQYQIAHSLFMLLHTIRNNMALREKSARLIQRFAEIPDLPVEDAGEFSEFAKEQGHLLLQTVNDWLETRRATRSDRVGRRTAVAGIHVYAYIGDIAEAVSERRHRPERN